MKKKYRLFSGLILGVIAVAWIVFLVVREPAVPDEKEGEELQEQLAEVAKKVKKSAPDEKPEDDGEKEPVSPDENDKDKKNPDELVLPDETIFDYIIANVKDSMNVREEAGIENSKVIATLPANGFGRIVDRGDEWYKIISGNVTGYVSTSYILTDTEAIRKMRELGALKIKINNNNVKIFKTPEFIGDVKKEVKDGDTFDYYPEFSEGMYYAIMVDGEICFVYNDFSEVYITLPTAERKDS